MNALFSEFNVGWLTDKTNGNQGYINRNQFLTDRSVRILRSPLLVQDVNCKLCRHMLSYVYLILCQNLAGSHNINNVQNIRIKN